MALDSAASKFGATNAQISAVATSVDSLGLGFEADPTRLFGRVTGSPAVEGGPGRFVVQQSGYGVEPVHHL